MQEEKENFDQNANATVKPEGGIPLEGFIFLSGKGGETVSGRYLTLKDRQLIARRYGEEARILDIANEIGCHPATIYEELRRGATGRMDANQRREYDPLLGQKETQAAIRRRGKHKKVLETPDR